MLTNITPRHYYEKVYYTYDYETSRNCGFTFPCNSDGTIDETSLLLPAIENLKYCRENPDKFEWQGIVKHNQHCTDPAYGTCSCGNTVVLIDQYYGACECEKCGKWYNLFGQELLKPEYWEIDEEPEDLSDTFESDYNYEEEEREEE